MADDPSAADRNVEIWKIKKLIKSLEAARGYVKEILKITWIPSVLASLLYKWTC